MCLAIPGKVINKKGNVATVDFGGIQREVRLDLVDAKVNEYVIVHAGYAIEKLSERDAKETLRYFEEIENAIQ